MCAHAYTPSVARSLDVDSVACGFAAHDGPIPEYIICAEGRFVTLDRRRCQWCRSRCQSRERQPVQRVWNRDAWTLAETRSWPRFRGSGSSPSLLMKVLWSDGAALFAGRHPHTAAVTQTGSHPHGDLVLCEGECTVRPHKLTSYEATVAKLRVGACCATACVARRAWLSNGAKLALPSTTIPRRTSRFAPFGARHTLGSSKHSLRRHNRMSKRLYAHECVQDLTS